MDVPAALAQWKDGPVRLVLTDDAASADVTLEVEQAGDMVGATAYTDVRAGVITGCRVAINAKYVGSKYGTQMLTHLAKLLSGWALHRTGMPVRSVTPGQGSRTDRA